MGIQVAIDGPASSGKGTVARMVAQALGYSYIDTGAMYRAVALRASEAGVDLADGPAVAAVAAGLKFRFSWDGERLKVHVDGQDVTAALRAESVGMGASAVSAHPPVRSALLELQRDVARAAQASGGGVVMEGRDIGTVVLPAAELKVYLDASLAVRALRRHAELAARGEAVPYESVEAEIAQRDTQDSTRAVAPLRRADDAIYLDTSDLTAAQAAAHVVVLARAREGGLTG